MPGKGTPRRTIRIADELWNSAAARAAAEDRELAEVIREFLTTYARIQPPTAAPGTPREDTPK